MLKNQSDTANVLRERSKLNKRLAYEGLLVGIVSVLSVSFIVLFYQMQNLFILL